MKGYVFSGIGCREESDCAGPGIECCIMGKEFRLKVISSYGRILEGCSSPLEKECLLPFPKEVIRRAIFKELSENPDPDLRIHLEVAYAQLEAFVPPEEYEVVEEFKLASSLAHERAKSGDPNDIIDSARILQKAKGERAVIIQEKISEKMKRRLEQIRSIGMSLIALEKCACPS